MVWVPSGERSNCWSHPVSSSIGGWNCLLRSLAHCPTGGHFLLRFAAATEAAVAIWITDFSKTLPSCTGTESLTTRSASPFLLCRMRVVLATLLWDRSYSHLPFTQIVELLLCYLSSFITRGSWNIDWSIECEDDPVLTFLTIKAHIYSSKLCFFIILFPILPRVWESVCACACACVPNITPFLAFLLY